MGIGPAVAIPELLQKVGMKVEDIDIWEINEAFASQATYSIEKVGIPREKLNPKGGAIALGHPLGCTGKFLSYIFQVHDKSPLSSLSWPDRTRNTVSSQCASEQEWVLLP